MKKFLLILITACVCWLPASVSQNLQVSAETLDTCAVPALSIDISVEDFTDMVSAQFIVAWDPAVLSYSHVSHNMPPPQTPFFIPNSLAGKLQFSWFDLSTPAGYDHPDGVLFTLHFNVLGSYGDMSPISFESTGPFPIEFYNTSGQVFTYTMVPGAVSFDNTNPVITGCPANPIVVSAPFGSVTYPVSWAAPIATDECGVESFTSNYNPGDNFTVANPPVTVTYTAVDSAGNTAVCNFTVDVIEGANPNALTFTANGDSLFCGDTIVIVPITVRNFLDMRTTQFGLSWNPAVLRYVAVTDKMNFPYPYPTALYNPSDSLSGRLRFGWLDADYGVDPGENIPDDDTIFILHLRLIDPGAASATVSFASFPFQAGPPVYPPYPVEFSNTSGIIPNNSVVLNNATVVNVQDIVDPSITCPSNITANADPGICTTTVNYIPPVGTDNCPMATTAQTAGLGSGASYPKGVTTNTFTVTDKAGNTASCSFTVTVIDNQLPAITCPSNLTANTDPGDCTAVVTYVTPAGTDNCPMATTAQTAGLSSGAAFPKGVTTNTFTVTDMAGNSASCSFTVTVNDNQLPAITCPANITANTASGVCTAVLTYTTPAGTDNCPMATTTQTAGLGSGATFPIGVTTNTFTVTDMAGNSATCNFTITVNDNQLPTLTGCPIAISVNNAIGECGANVTWTAPTASDNCGVASMTADHVNGSFFDAGTTTVTYTVTDVNGNLATCSFTVTVVDKEDPQIICPANFTQDNDPGVCEAIVTLPAPVDLSDNCPGVTYTSAPVSGSAFPLGTTTVTYEATDAAGRTASCTFEVTVVDAEAPDITCPANISQDNDTDECSAIVTLPSATADDLCSLPVTVSNNAPAGNEFPVGPTTVTFTATDDAGNTATCSITVTVDDAQDPIISGCPGNITETTDPGNCDAVVNWTAPTASDNCSATITASHDPGDKFPKGTTTVTYTAEDGAGNTATCSFDITVADDEAPQLECPADVTVQIPAGTTSGVVNNIPLFSLYDNCGVDTSYWHFTGATTNDGNGVNASGATFNLGVTAVTYFAEDAAGNMGNCAFTVTVEEENLLEITCPGNQASVNDPGNCSAAFSGLAAMVIPASGATNLSYQLSGATTGSGNGNVPGGTDFNAGTTTVTYTTFNSAGNVTCSFTAKVTDDEDPVISGCPLTNLTSVNDPGDCGAVVTWPAPTVSDNCGVIAFTVSQTPGTFFDAETTPVEYVAVDASGNVSKCEFKVIVEDTEKPVFTVCPGNFTVNTDPGNCAAFVAWAAPAATDNCSAILTATNQPGTFAVGTSQVQYTATDPSGNMATCSFKITVVDNQPPFIFNIPSNLVVLTQPDECGAIVSWPMPGAQDNCGIESFGCNISSGTFFDVTTPGNPVEVECIALDIHGNVKIASFTVTVIDNTPPVIACPGNVTVSVDGGTLNDPSGFLTGIDPMDCEKTVLSYSMVTATDACGIASLVLTQGPASGSAFSLGSNTLAFKAMDTHGNESTCSFTVEVIPTEAAVADAFPLTPCEGEDVFFFVNDYPGATYTWKDPNGDVVGSGNNFTLSAIETSQSGVFTVDISLPYCNLQGSVAIGVAPVPDIDITANDLLCTSGNMPLNLVASDLANSGVVEWIWEFPNGSFAFGQNQTVNNATPANGGTYSLTAVSDDGCVGYGAIDVQIFSEPMMPSLFGTSGAVCKGTQVILNGQTFSGSNVTYHWSATPAAGSGLNPINNSLVSVTPTVPGQYTYHYFVTVDGCASDTATWVMNVEAAPALALSIDGQTTCVVGTSSVTLMETGGQASNWQWEGPSGPIPGNSASIVLQNVNTATSGLYKVVATTDLGCQSTASIPVSITMKPATAVQLIASTDAICSGGTVTLSGTPYSGATYVWTGPNLPPFPQNLSTINVSLNQAGNFDYTFAAIVNGCSTDTVATSILVETMPSLNITTTGPTKCVSGTTSVVLSSNSPDAASWQWTNGSGSVIANTEMLTLPNVTSSISGTYSVTASSSIGCKSTGNYTLNITDGLPPVKASLKGKACEDAMLEFDATIIPGAAYAWRKSGGNIFSNLQSPTIQSASSAVNGNYIVTASLNGCTSSDTVNVSVLTAPNAVNEVVVGIVNVPQSFNVVVNDQLADGEPYTISVLQQPQNGSVSVGSQGVLTFHPKAGFRENDKMFYEICYNACPDLCDIASVELRVRYPGDTCVITSLITPNGDGVNDNFVVSCLEVQDHPLNKLIVFNQWGDKVYDAAPYKNDWKGTYEGRDLPDGTYFYIFQRDPDVPVEKGFVMIYR